jgi:hypothetical protein
MLQLVATQATTHWLAWQAARTLSGQLDGGHITSSHARTAESPIGAA